MGAFDDLIPGNEQPSAESSGSVFDDLIPKQKQNKGLVGDLGTDLKRSFQSVPGAVTGLLDIPVAAITGKPMVSKGWDLVGEKTGFQPSKWNEEAKAEYSPARIEANRQTDEAWKDGTAMDIAGSYLKNPGHKILGPIVESVAPMVAGGIAARGITTAAKVAPMIAGGIGEGGMMAGSQMQGLIDEGVDARKAAGYSALTGIAGAGLGMVGGKVANSKVGQRLGLSDIDTAMAGGVRSQAIDATGMAAAKEYGKRIIGGGVVEGLIEEAPQSMMEKGLSNLAQDKPVTEGLARAGVEGALAGFGMGAAFNAIPGSKYIESKRAPAEDQPIAGLLPAPTMTGTPSEQMLQSEVERQNAVDAAQKNADQLYAERAAYQEELAKLYPSGLPTLTTDPAPLQQRIDQMLGIDETKLKGLRKIQYQKQFEAALKEVVGITHDANGREIPLTMGALLDSQAMAEDAAKRRVASENAGIRAQQLADEEMPDVAAPSIPVVGPLSAAANVAVQSGASQAMAMQQAAASVSNQGQSDTQGGISRAAQTSPLAQAPAQANDAQTKVEQTTAPAIVARMNLDVADRTDDQLSYLAKFGMNGWREAAIAEAERRATRAAPATISIGDNQVELLEYDGIVPGFPDNIYRTSGGLFWKTADNKLAPISAHPDGKRLADFMQRYPQEWVSNGIVNVDGGEVKGSTGRIIEGQATRETEQQAATGLPDATAGESRPAPVVTPQAAKASESGERQKAVDVAASAAANALANGGSEADANRAATDSLIDSMRTVPGISISQDAPAAVQAAKSKTSDQSTIKSADQPRAETVTAPAKADASPVSQPKTDAARKPLHKFENKETGMAAMVVEGAKPGLFNVVLRDEDSGEYVPIAVTGFDSVEKAIERAKHVVDLKQDKHPANGEQDADTRFAKNTIFTADKVAAAKARMKAKLGTLNSGIDPEMLIDGMTVAGAYIESGVRKFADYAKAMVEDLGDGVKPYLLSFYEAVRAYPGLDKTGMDSADAAASQHQAMLTTDGKAAYDLSNPEGKFKVATEIADFFIGGGEFKTIIEARKKIAELIGRPIEAATELAKQADETIETAVVLAGRDIVKAGRKQGRSAEVIYDRLVDLYRRQPNLAVRSSTSVRDQAYSTPVPLAYLASELAGINYDTKVLEPTAGNGMLLIGTSIGNAVANELNPGRAGVLRSIGFNPTERNAATERLRHAGYPVDVVIANPPFGATKDANGDTIIYDIKPGFQTREVDHAIVFKSLETMKDDGRAVLIVGGTNAMSEEGRRDDYRGKNKRTFYYNLYNDYNVIDHFTVDGDLYSKQGASYPVDVIVIDGRGKSSRDLPAADLPKVISSYEALKEKLNVENRMDAGRVVPARVGSGDAPARGGDAQAVAGSPVEPGNGNGTEGAARTDGSGVPNARTGSDAKPAGSGAVSGGWQSQSANPSISANGRRVSNEGGKAEPGTDSRNKGNNADGLGGTSVVDGQRVESGLTDRRGQEQETENQVAYTPQSGGSSVGTLVPRAMRDSIESSLQRIADQVGGIDQYVAESLDMDPDTVRSNFSAEQIDALALSISNAEAGKGFIIGDQTGIGKGRVVAAMIRYALVNGKIPIFVTEKPNLYSDMIRDLDDIGMSEDLGLDTKKPKILITNGSETIPYTLLRNVDGDVVENNLSLKSPKSGKAFDDMMQSMINSDSLGEYRVIFTTYSQLQTVKGKDTARQKFIKHFGASNYMIFDESHNAGGAGDTQARSKEQRQAAKEGQSLVTGRAAFVRNLVQKAFGTFFSSATYAKRPDVMDLYSSTNMKLAVDRISQLGEAIKSGGVPMQQVVANMLTKDGQYIRRERTFAGVAYDTVETPVDKSTAENMAIAMRSILAFSRRKESVIKAMQKEFDRQGAMLSAVGGETTSVQGANFGSIMHNLIDQMLLSLKVQSSVDHAITRLKAGEKVVMTVSNTMGSFLQSYAEDLGLSNGDTVALSFSDLYERYLEKQRIVSIKSGNGEKKQHRLTDAELGPDLVAMYEAVRKQIRESGFGSAPISPIDYMHSELRKAGYKTDEITGRTMVLNYGKTGAPVLASRSANIKQRVGAVSAFNNGGIDVLILNQAGSTGLSLHASSKVKDQRKRHMIVVQAEKNIDTHMQMLGRVHRTGQVVAPAYSQMMADVPAEMRPASVLLKKMASLNANTTASRKSSVTAEGVVDFMNDYGGQVVHEFLRDNPEVLEAVGGPDVLKLTDDSADGVEEDIRKFTGYIPILPIRQQEEIYRELIERYNDLIERENSMGTNKLEAKAADLDAETLSSVPVTESKEDQSVFATPAFMEKVDVKRAVKPYSGQEVAEMILARLKGTAAHVVVSEQISSLRERASEFARARVEKMEADKADPLKIEMTKNQLNAAFVHVRTILSSLKIGDTVSIKDSAGQILYGAITNVDQSGKTANPAAGSAWKMTIALANGDAKSITLNFSQIGGKYEVSQANNVDWYNIETQSVERVSVMSLFDKGATLRREKRWIVTGNILAGYSRFPGQIITYTKKDGTSGQGVLMSRQFDFEKEMKNAPVSIKSGADAVRALNEAGQGTSIGTRDRAFLITNRGNRYEVTTPSSKKDGGTYYLDTGITDIIGDFYKRGSVMMASIYGADDVSRLVDYLNGERQETVVAVSNIDSVKKALGLDQKQGAGNIATPSTISPADKAIYGMAAEGKSAAEILKFVASASRSPFNRQVAKLLMKTGINPSITVGDGKGWKFNAGEGNKYAAGYDPQKNMISLFKPGAAERNMLHELIHAATIKALGKKGLASAQMKALFRHVEKNGKSVGLFYDQKTKRGIYGMANIDEFIAEAFSNPKFQALLKQVSAPKTTGNPLSSAWHWFSRIVRGILGLPMNTESALSQALEIGVEVMRENMRLNVDADGGKRYATGPKQTDSAAFRKWFGDSKVVDENGQPLVVYNSTSKEANNGLGITEFKHFSHFGNLAASSRFAEGDAGQIYPVYLSIKNPLRIVDTGLHHSMLDLADAIAAALGQGRPKYGESASGLLRSNGYDGLVYLNRREGLGVSLVGVEEVDGVNLSQMSDEQFKTKFPEASDSWVPLRNTQIKSAIGNNGNFDGSNPDIRYNVADEGWSVSEQAKEAVMRLAGRPMLDPADPFAAENARLREQDQSLWSKAKKQLRRYLAPGGLLPQSVFAEKIKRDSEFQAVEFDVRHLIGGLEHAVKTDFGMAFDKLSKEQMRPITEALAGNIPDSLPEATKTAAIAMRQYIDGMSTEYLKIIQEKIDAKMLKALETGKDADKAQAINDIELFEKIKGNIGRYVHRSYQAFDDPKWFEKVPATVLNASRLYLKQGYMEAGETDAKAAQLAEVTLHEILKNGTAYDSMESFIAESKLGAKDLSVLMRRKEVPAQIRALLGEYPDARLNFTKSATKMGRLIWNTRFLDRVRDIGMGSFFFEGKDRPPAATTQIAAEGSEVYAPLNGLWTFPEIAQSFKDALGKEQMGDLYRAIVRANGLVKYGKTVLAPTTAMRNWQSAMFFSLANGHFDLTQMKKSIAAFREQVSQSATGGDLKYLRHLKQLGVVYDTPYAGEMARLMEDARMEELLSSDKVDAVRWFRKANQMAQGFYTFGDDFWKIIGFENEKSGLMKAGLSLQEAEVEAAKRIRDTYPTYSMVGRGVQWLSRFPLAGTFVSFPAEIIRTSSNMLRTVAADLKSDNPKLRELGMRRAAGMAFVSAAFWSLAALSKAMAGVGDDEEEAIRDLAPEWQKNSTFLFAGRDEKGNLRYFDMSFLDPYGYWKRPITAMMRDQPWEDSLASGLRGMLEPFLGADIAAKAVFEAVANQKESGGKVYKEKDGAIDQAVDIADHLRKALQPGVVGNVERLVKASTDVRRSSGQPYSVEDEMVALVGWRATTVEPKTALYYRAFDFTDALAEARKTLTDTLRDANDVSPEDIKDAKERAKAKQEQAFSEMQRLVGSAEAAGMSKMQIIQTLRLSNISQANIASLMRGATPAVTVTPQLAAKAVQQAKQLRGDEFAAEVSSRYRQAMTN